MMPMPPRALQRCRSDATLSAACPATMPLIEDVVDLGRRAVVTHPMGRDEDYRAFNAEWGAPYRDEINRRDRPSRFTHLVVHAGDLSMAFPFGWPGENDPPPGQPEPRDLGPRRWDGRNGRLVLAPPYPFGGGDGSHLIFRWSEDRHDYAISLHAWIPLNEAEAALERTVRSIP